MTNPKTRNSYSSCVNRILNEQQIKLKIKLERQGLDWREVDKQINQLGDCNRPPAHDRNYYGQ